MSAILFLIVLGIIVAGGFVLAFIWAVRTGQYDDDYTPSVRMLFDAKKPGNSDSGGDAYTDETKQSDNKNQ